jgi:hypothetical protein
MPRLRRSNCAAPGIARVRRGRGFQYRDHDGRAPAATSPRRTFERGTPPSSRQSPSAPTKNAGRAAPHASVRSTRRSRRCRLSRQYRGGLPCLLRRPPRDRPLPRRGDDRPDAPAPPRPRSCQPAHPAADRAGRARAPRRRRPAQPDSPEGGVSASGPAASASHWRCRTAGHRSAPSARTGAARCVAPGSA